MTLPKISVVVPAYNAERTILETIASVRQQTLTDFELIVINDGSTDQTLELVSTVKDERLRVFSYTNGGLSTARNRGIAQARGEFITFIDADDLWTGDKLERQLAALEASPQAGFAYSWAYYMKETEKCLLPDRPIFYAGNVYEQLLVRDFIVSGSNCMMRKQAIAATGEFDPSLYGTEDWDYWIRLARHWQAVVIPQYQIFYRQSSSSMLSQVERVEASNFRVIEKAYQSAPAALQALKSQSLANTYRFLAHLYVTRVGSVVAAKQAAQYLWTAIRLHPQILSDSWTRNLLFKAYLMQILSPSLSQRLINRGKQLHRIRQPNVPLHSPVSNRDLP